MTIQSQVDGAPSHIPAPAPSHISMHIKITNAFLQSSSIQFQGSRSKSLSRVVWQSHKKKKKKDPKSYFLTFSDPQTCPGAKFCTAVFYPYLSLIWYATWLCLYKMDIGPFGAPPPPPPHTRPCPQGLHPNSECVPPILIHTAITCDSFKVLAKTAYEELCDNQKKRDPKS